MFAFCDNSDDAGPIEFVLGVSCQGPPVHARACGSAWTSARRRYPAAMSRKPPLSSEGAKRMAERERKVGLEPDDEAARWLEEHDAPPEAPPSKAFGKSKELHRWRRQQGR